MDIVYPGFEPRTMGLCAEDYVQRLYPDWVLWTMQRVLSPGLILAVAMYRLNPKSLHLCLVWPE